MSQHYDVAVIGMQRTGVIAAALLAKRGRRVLLVDHGENTRTYRRRGLTLPLMPTLLPELEDSPHVKRVLDELGVGPELRAGRVALDPAFQAVMPGHRVDIRGDRNALLKELKLEFPDVAEGIELFFNKLYALDTEISGFLTNSSPLIPSSWRERIQARGLMSQMGHLDAPFESHQLFDGIPSTHPVRDLLLSPLSFFGHLPIDAPSTFHAVRLLARYFKGAVAYPDRLGDLVGMMLNTARNAGVEVKESAMVKRLSLSGKKIVEVEIEDERLTFSADFFIANTLTPFYELLPASKAQSRLAAEQQATRPAGGLLVFNFVVRREVIPLGMGEAVFLLNGRRQARAGEPPDPPLFLRRYPAQRSSRTTAHQGQAISEREHEVLSIACPVQISHMKRSLERLAAMKQFIHRRVERLIPFLRDHLVDTSLPCEPASWDTEGSSGNPWRVDPWSLHPFTSSRNVPYWAWQAARCKRHSKTSSIVAEM